MTRERGTTNFGGKSITIKYPYNSMKSLHLFSCILLICLIFIGCDEENKITDGNTSFTGIVKTTPVGTIIDDDPDDWEFRCIADDSAPFCVKPAFPNPAGKDSVFLSGENPILACCVHYSIATATHVNIIIKDRPDNIVCTLVNDFQEAGIYIVLWELKDDSGELLPDGIYRVYITATIEDETYQSYGDIQIERDTE